MFIDSHAHLSMLLKEKNVPIEDILAELKQNNVKTVLNISGNSEEFEHALSLRDIFKENDIDLFHAAGIHPHEAQDASKDYLWIRKNASKIIAIGEVGLDFHYNFSPEKEQEDVFRNMIKLSIELKKPLIVHGRNAEDRALEIFEEYGDKIENVLFHCYTGSMKTAQKIIEKSWLISFSGILTFKRSTEFHDILKEIGIKKVFFETDSPFLAPVPFRGRVNTPGKVFHVYDFASRLLEIEKDTVAKIVANNFNNFFNIS